MDENTYVIKEDEFTIALHPVGDYCDDGDLGDWVIIFRKETKLIDGEFEYVSIDVITKFMIACDSYLKSL